MHNTSMRTTLDLNDALLLEAKRLAAERRTSVKALVEDGLRAVIGVRLRETSSAYWPIDQQAKPVPGVDLTRTAELLEASDTP